MKTLFKSMLLAVMATVMTPIGIVAQEANPMLQPLPVDQGVRIGHLPNGLTYYIRHNENPKGLADFYIAQKVGSILEEDSQRGLAHFLEHMCFNGTTNFPDNQLRDWLESIGVKFGADLNAYTSIDETVYNISNVPVARESVVDSCLLILHDWANDLTLDPKEIDKERGVIHEEWRRTMQGTMRIYEKILPDLFPTSRYGSRLPIGIMEVVDNFPPQDLRDYYETWYRPDQQAVVVVGDIDVDVVENKIKEMFSSIEMPADAKPRLYEQVPVHKGYLFGIGSDPEQKQLTAQLTIMQDVFPDSLKNTPSYYIDSYAKSMISGMLNSRLGEISSKPDAPFAAAGFGFDNYIIAKTRDGVTLSVSAKEKDIIEPLKAVYREVLRASRGGFSQSEYDRMRQNYLSHFERIYANRDTRQNETFVKEYVGNFKDAEPIPGLEVEWNLAQEIANLVTLPMLNSLMAQVIVPDGRAVVVMAPEKEGYVLPTPEAITKALEEVDAETIEAFVDSVKSEPLIAKAPVAGKIVKTIENDKWGTTEWVLSNGARVIVKPTKYKESEILFRAQALNGFADYPAEYAPTILNLGAMLSNYGLGSYNSRDLGKYLAGKMASLGISINSYTRGLSGNATPKDLPTLMELIYAAFTDLTFDPDQFLAYQKAMSTQLANQATNPQFLFNKGVMETLYASPFNRAMDIETLNAASLDLGLNIAHDALSNAADFTFFFVGNVDLETLRPLVETYIASLPGNEATARREVKKFDPALFVTPGTSETSLTAPMTTPQTLVTILETGDLPFTPSSSQIASIAGQILTARLIKTVREDMGAVYSIGASGGASRMGLTPFTIGSSFPMKPEMKREVLDFISSQFKAMESDVTAEELNPIKEYMVKSMTEAYEHNNPWLGAIMGYEINGVDTFNGAIDTINAITTEDVMNFMKALNAQGNYRVITCDPEQ